MPKAYPLTLYYVCCLVTIFSNIFLPLFFISRILVCAPLSWSTEHFPPAEVGGLLPEFFHARLSSERDIPAQACRFSCFFCAAYGLLLTQTRTRCSNSVCKAIAMLANPAKICQRSAFGSGDICTLIMKVVNLCKWAVLLSRTWGWNCVRIFPVFTNFGFCACSISAHSIYKNIGVFYMTALVREGYPSADIWRNFRSFFEHSDCSRRTV